MDKNAEIPILDLSPLKDPESLAYEKLSDQVIKVYSEIGFGYLKNHGIDPTLRDSVFQVNKAFHNLPLTEKLKIKLNNSHRGYIAMESSTDRTSELATVTKPNQSESYMMMREDASHDPDVYLSGPNQWPAHPTNFRQTMEEYHKQMCALGNDLIRLIATGLGISPDIFAKPFQTPTTWLRLLHYPPTIGEMDRAFGSAPHCDFGAITLLAQDNVGGLQVMTDQKQWIDAPYIQDHFVMNVGDMLNRLSNGILKSTPHRVINSSGCERYSVPFFYDPHVNTTIQPHPSLGDPKFKPFKFADFLRSQLESSYDDHQEKDI